ncbi:MAG: TRAP transporter permease [Tissierellales bacterium]|nr:TRAP transporter permease [Tissierellales bacterium]MBN2827928.1 TRAP transporter permease [Tissierellales bacterium]
MSEDIEDIKKKSKKRQLSGTVKSMVAVIAIVMSVFHLYTAAFRALGPIQQRSIHLIFVLTLIFIIYPASSKSPQNKPSIFDWILIALSFASIGNIIIRFRQLALTGGLYIQTDIIFGVITIILIVEAARRTIGYALPLLSAIFILYAFLGRYVPGPLMHSGFSLNRIIQHLYMTTEGVFGQILGVSSTYIYMFILFGAFLSATGMSSFFNDLALSIAGHAKGGPAKVSVLSSGLMGSISGSTSANVVTTGSFTIPLMIKTGYKDYFASGIEAAASAGGQIMPPVMGAAAFIISDSLAIPFVQVLAAALIPAILYYIGVWAIVHLRASKMGIEGIPKAELPKTKDVILSQGHLFIPLIGIIYMLVSGYNALYAAVWGIILAVLSSLIKKETRINIPLLMEALKKGALNAVPVAIACAIIGIVIGVTSLTGAILALASAILKLSGGYLFTTLILTMIVSIIMGMGLPTTACYVLTSAVAAPALIRLGVAPLGAHMFVFYFGILSTITPPVAVGSYAAAGISGADPAKTGWAGMKLAIAGFIIPFMFIYSPDLLITPDSTILKIIPVFVTSVIGVVALGAAVEGYFIKSMSMVLRPILMLGAILLILSGTMTDLVGFGLVFGIFGFQFLTARKLRT